MRVLSIIIILCTTNALFAQQITYDVVKGSKVIGKMEVKRSQAGQRLKLDIKNDVEFTLLFSFTSVYWLSETFENGKLVSGDSHNVFNGKRQKETTVKREGLKYYISEDDDPNYFTSRDITYTVANLYYTEPVNKTQIFSQWFGKYLKVDRVSTNVYKLTSPDGVNRYTYENGICTEVQVNRDFATFYFKIQEESFARASQTK